MQCGTFGNDHCVTLATTIAGSATTCTTGKYNDICGDGGDCDSTYCGTDSCTNGADGDNCDANDDCQSAICDLIVTVVADLDGEVIIATTDF